GNQTLEQQKQYTFDMITSYGGNKIVGGETCSMRYKQTYPWGGESDNEVITRFNRVEVQFGFIFR
ncbi:MAG: hypothetical protein R6W81_15650, partial [Bacteroidales bacterium]